MLAAPAWEGRSPWADILIKKQPFSAEEVHAFVEDVGDTNPLHAGDAPLVPGLEILEASLSREEICRAARVELRFHGASFAGEMVSVQVRSL